MICSMKFTIRSDHVFLFVLSVGWILLCGGQADEDLPSIAPMEKREQEALYAAIQGFVGKSWNGSYLYPDPCGWTPIQGVSCDLFNGFWYITALSIGPVLDNSLECTTNAKFTHYLFEFNHLKSLSIFSCFLSSTKNPTKIPTSNWNKFSYSLEYLEFRSNPGLIGSIPLRIGYLKRLQSLVLLENGLMGTLPTEIGNLVHLKRLVLAGNRFSGPIPASLGGLTDLLIFDASRNLLSGPFPLTLGGLTSLLKLDLSENMLEGKLPHHIGSLRNLTLLDLRCNNISGGLIQSLEEMVSLKEMAMSNNPVGGDLNGIQWKILQDLEILDLSNCGLMGPIPESMAEMGSLRFLGLGNNYLSGNPSPRLASVPNLGGLLLNDNNFTGMLDFSETFYRRMGRRFRAWNNPNMCYRAESISKLYVPYGVQPCN